MKRALVLFFATIFTLPWLAGSPGRADFVSWGYNWTGSPKPVTTDGDGTGGIFLLEPSPGQASGTSTILATEVGVFTSASPALPDRFTDKAYSLSLSLTDDASNTSGKLTFTGLFNGTLSSSQASITNTFTGPTTQSLTLGGNLYTVTIGPYAPPTLSTLGSISALVSVEGEAPPPPPSPVANVPEPSSLALAGLGLSVLGLGCWCQWKGLKPVAPG